MLKSNVMDIIGIFAALALSSLFLIRGVTLSQPGALPANVVAAESAAPAPVVISSYPADVVVIEALPHK